MTIWMAGAILRTQSPRSSSPEMLLRSIMVHDSSPAVEFFETPVKTWLKGIIDVYYDGTEEG